MRCGGGLPCNLLVAIELATSEFARGGERIEADFARRRRMRLCEEVPYDAATITSDIAAITTSPPIIWKAKVPA